MTKTSLLFFTSTLQSSQLSENSLCPWFLSFTPSRSWKYQFLVCMKYLAMVLQDQAKRRVENTTFQTPRLLAEWYLARKWSELKELRAKAYLWLIYIDKGLLLQSSFVWCCSSVSFNWSVNACIESHLFLSMSDLLWSQYDGPSELQCFSLVWLQ